MPSAFAELNEKGDRVDVHFRFDQETKDAVKAIGGAKFVPRDKGGPLWRLPLDLVAMRRLREIFGSDLQLGDGLIAWGREQVREERKLHEMATADDWPLDDLLISKKLPAMAAWLRPYQRADVKFLGHNNALNLLEPRLGKTTETIGAIYEGDLEDGAHLIVALQKSLDSVWRYEWERWTDMPVFTFSGETNSTDRAKIFTSIERMYEREQPFVFCTTADMIRRGLPDQLELAFDWNTFTIDEFHKTGLPEVKNKFPQACEKIRTKRRWALSGTPMGGKEIKLWGALHFLDKDRFSSKWAWAGQWLQIETVFGNHKKIGGLKRGREDEFYAELAKYAVRRLRTEVLPDLPPKQWIDVWCDMSRPQRKQYTTFENDAEIRIDEYHLSATSVLAEYTRLKQFSNARQEVVSLKLDEDSGHMEMKLKPTFDSGKLPVLLEKLAEQGIDPEDPGGDSQALVCSQFREIIEMVYNYLTKKGIPCIKITGKVSKEESERAQRAFKAEADHEGLRVVCMVTTMGVGLTLDNIETVHCLDETWNPDDQEQVTDRAINTNRNHQVSVFMYRSKNSIESFIYETTAMKANINKEILDIRRQRFKESRAVA